VKNVGRGVGLKFYGVSADRFRIVAKVMFADIDPIYDGRASAYVKIGVVFGTFRLVALALNQTLRGLYYVVFKRGGSVAAPIARSTESSAT